MTEKNSKKIQYLAGICASLTFMFTGAALSWPSPTIPKFKSGEAGFEITDEQTSWVVALLSAGALPGCYLGQVLSERAGRQRTFLLSAGPGVLGLKFLQYMTGVLVIQSYLEVIFRQSSSVSGPRASIIYGFVQLIAGVCATFLTRWCRRRVLLVISCFGVSVAMTIVGVYFYLQDKVQVGADTLEAISMLPLVGLIGFNILYSFGVGNLPYVLQAELFPVNVKAVASSLATQFACILSFLVTKFYHSVKEIFGHYTVFWSFACIGYIGVVFIYFCVPETGNKTLEEVQDNVQIHTQELVALRSYDVEKIEQNNKEVKSNDL